jgi:hypothetical protein
MKETGKATVMCLANNGTLPKFSKYSGVVQWNNSYFLWVNIFPSNVATSSSAVYENKFLESGQKMTWFGGSLMRPGWLNCNAWFSISCRF